MTQPASVVIPSAARTAGGLVIITADELNLEFDPRGALFYVNVTAVAGTGHPTLALTISGFDASGNPVPLHAPMPGILTMGERLIQVEPAATDMLGSYPVKIGRFLPFPYQVAWAISGNTPSFTFEIDVQYF